MRKPAPPREIPPPLELECLKALWALGEGNVKEVREYLSPRRPLAYTTVMTLLERLVKKGGAARRKVGRSFRYQPVLEKNSLRCTALRELLDSLFEGSPGLLRTYLDAVSTPASEQGGGVMAESEAASVREDDWGAGKRSRAEEDAGQTSLKAATPDKDEVEEEPGLDTALL